MFLWLTVTLGLTELLTLAKVVLQSSVIRINMEFVILAFILETLETHCVNARLMGPAWSATRPINENPGWIHWD